MTTKRRTVALGLLASPALLHAGSRAAWAAPESARPAASTAPVEPRAGSWKTWLLTSGSQFRPAPPPDRAATEAELRELKSLAGRRDEATLDRIAYWDAGAAPYRWTEAT